MVSLLYKDYKAFFTSFYAHSNISTLELLIKKHRFSGTTMGWQMICQGGCLRLYGRITHLPFQFHNGPYQGHQSITKGVTFVFGCFKVTSPSYTLHWPIYSHTVFLPFVQNITY